MKKILIVVLAAVGLATCGGCDFWSQASGQKDPDAPDVLNSGSGDVEVTVVTVDGTGNTTDVRERSDDSNAQ